jgi:hypothetical protein
VLLYTEFKYAIYVIGRKICNNREFKLPVLRETANAGQRKILRYQAIESK